tara:strand:- start:784 stop:1020 length:237 start_codon:yes stop_codon:yes gene_type:complete
MVPIIEYIPIEAGPNTRYFILLSNRTEEIDDAKSRKPLRKRLRGSRPLEYWFDRIGEDLQNLEGSSTTDPDSTPKIVS